MPFTLQLNKSIVFFNFSIAIILHHSLDRHVVMWTHVTCHVTHGRMTHKRTNTESYYYNISNIASAYTICIYAFVSSVKCA